MKKLSAADLLINFFMMLCVLVTLYPFIYVLSYSFSNGNSVSANPIVLLPVDLTLENYRAVFANNNIVRAFLVSVARTSLGLSCTLLVTGLASYGLSKNYLPGRKWLSYFCIIPMYFSGGMIATYINIRQLGLMNNFWVYILPYGFVAYYMLVMRTYFAAIPKSLEESAMLDGAGDILIFFRIIVPLSMPIIATIALFAGVFQWNAWYDAMVYVPKRSLHPLQLLLQNILKNASGIAAMKLQVAFGDKVRVTADAVQMATLVVTTVPILAIYPFLQKYFVKGVMIGAIKS